MRELLRAGEVPMPHVAVRVASGVAVHFDALMLSLTSARYRQEGGECLRNIAQEVRDLDQDVLEKVRDLVHRGSADFEGARHHFYQAFYLTEVLQLEECHAAFQAASAQQSSHVDLGSTDEQACLRQLRELYRTYPRELPRGCFDTQFVLTGSGSPCQQAHRLVLAAASGYFRALLQHSEMGDPCQPWKIELAEVGEAAVQAALDLIYLGEAAVPRRHFPAFALQADGWQMEMVSEACWTAILDDSALAESVLQDGAALPDNLVMAVAYSHPSFVSSDADVEHFIRALMVPSLAAHLSVSLQAPTDCESGLWGPRTEIPDVLHRARMISAQGRAQALEYARCVSSQNHAAGRREERSWDPPTFGEQLEGFIAGPGFDRFLSHPAALKLPAQSVTMVMECLFLKFSDWHPGHAWYGLSLVGPKGRPPAWREKGCGKNWHPCAFPDNIDNEKVAAWLVGWASQPPAACPLEALLRVRGAIWHRHGAAQGKHAFRSFWLDLFRQVLRAHPETLERLLLESDAHFAQAAEMPHAVAWRKGGKTRHPDGVLMREWATRHGCFEAVFLNAAEDLRTVPLSALRWSLQSVSAATLLRVVASDGAPHDVESVLEALRLWLRGEAPGAPGAEDRLAALQGAVVGLPDLLKYPWSGGRNQPGNLRHMRPRAHLDLLENLALAHLVTMFRGEEGSAVEEEAQAAGAPASGEAA